MRARNRVFDVHFSEGWSGGAMVLGKLPVPVRPTNLDCSREGPTALAVGAGGGCLDIFTLVFHFSPFSPSLWETARYRLKYCLKGPLNPTQPTNQHFLDAREKVTGTFSFHIIHIHESLYIFVASDTMTSVFRSTKIVKLIYSLHQLYTEKWGNIFYC